MKISIRKRLRSLRTLLASSQPGTNPQNVEMSVKHPTRVQRPLLDVPHYGDRIRVSAKVNARVVGLLR
jgi:hypothetical protein